MGTEAELLALKSSIMLALGSVDRMLERRRLNTTDLNSANENLSNARKLMGHLLLREAKMRTRTQEEDIWDRAARWANDPFFKEKVDEALRASKPRRAGGSSSSSGFRYTPPRSPDCWSVLGLQPGASKSEINAAWRELAKTKHPDVGGSDEAMVELNQARAAALAMARL
ncbi:J domain-containing protein [Rhodoplanes sp. TEM]|uniref:J domain-containing protein n=1 Tax=Rhodoplanes tepidamans TaxID=200616 RepID=A0ABT5J5C3_RHOTP|nr:MULTISPECIES: J domain-containing protein [Rhodoplanes]MDC7784832.1 J domain-containing protein [Rhodoplanes tepidamans]MDC7982299.1 J domain-containing protein [Rhodoplanes sp. TEM]MDQ0356307.1 hypothetical protein [Rhodoplanes tepidamans]